MGDAKLLRPLGLAAAAKPPPTPENPLPRAPNPEVPEADAKPLVLDVADWKTEVVDVPRTPNGELSEPAKAARLDDANADVEGVLSAGFSVNP